MRTGLSFLRRARSALPSSIGSNRTLVVQRDAFGNIDTHRPQILITNGWTSTIEALHSIAEHKDQFGVHCHQNLSIIRDFWWLERIHKSHYDNPWGQYGHDFDVKTQQLILKANGWRHMPKRILTWKEILNTHLYAIETLQEWGVSVTEGRADTSGMYKKNGKLWLPIGQHDTTILTSTSEDCFFYNFVRVDRMCSIDGIKDQPSYMLYALRPEELPKQVTVFGCGVQCAWLVRDFPSIQFIFIKRKEDEPMTTPLIDKTFHTRNGKKWWEQDNILSLLNIEDLKRDNRLSYTEEGEIELVLDSGGTMITPVFAAMSSTRNPNPFPDFIPKENQIIAGSSASQLAPGSFVAPQNLPVGSHMHASLEYKKATNQAIKSISPLLKEELRQWLSDMSNEVFLGLGPDQINSLIEVYANKIKSLDHNPETHEESTKLLIQSYNEIENNITKRSKFVCAVMKYETEPPYQPGYTPTLGS